MTNIVDLFVQDELPDLTIKHPDANTTRLMGLAYNLWLTSPYAAFIKTTVTMLQKEDPVPVAFAKAKLMYAGFTARQATEILAKRA
jgi:hypothetical protein